MRDIKDTEIAIGAGRLTASDRRKIFDDFLNAGGEVISENRKTQERKRRYSSSLKEERKTVQKSRPGTAEKERAANPAPARSVIPVRKPVPGFFQKFIVRFSLFWLNVLNSGKFHPDFILAVNHRLKSSLYSFYALYTEIFEKKRKRSENVSEALNSQSPLYFKLIQMAGELYPEFYSDSASFEKTVGLHKMKGFFTVLYRKLFTLYPYRSILNDGMDALFDAVQNMYGDVIPEELGKEKVLKNLDYVFSVFYKKLHWLVCYYEKTFFAPDRFMEIEKFLDIKPDEKPENRKCETVFKIQDDEKAAEEQAEQAQPEEEEKEPDINDKLAAAGFEIMNSMNMQELRKKYDTRKMYELVPENDTVLVSFILFTRFIREYSFIFDTGKIRFDGTVYIGSLIYPECLRDLYYETEKMDENFLAYAETADTYEKMKMEKPSGGGESYFAYSRRIQEILVRKERSSTFLRMTLKSLLERIMTVLVPLLDSMNKGGNDILNPDEVMQDSSTSAGRSLKGKTVREAVITVAGYVSAFIKRMGTEGDLFDYTVNVSEKKEEPVHKAVENSLNLEYVMNRTEGQDDDGRSVFDQIDDIVF